MRGLLDRFRAKSSGLGAQNWIATNTGGDLTIAQCGAFPTSQGQIAALDPLAFWQLPNYVSVPKTGGRVVVFHDVAHARNSKLALIFKDTPVVGGADVDTCAVSAGMASFFSPETYTATDAFYKALKDGADPYNDFFAAHDEPEGGERKIVPLPDGTPVPYVHSGWGDGNFPVFTLHDKNDSVCAIYIDFMGRDDGSAYLTPPGVSLT